MALYFCSGMLQDREQFRHYALNVPLYTHFTSPIRRFADVMVHRLLAATLGKRRSSGMQACAHLLAAHPLKWVPRGHTAMTMEAPAAGTLDLKLSLWVSL